MKRPAAMLISALIVGLSIPPGVYSAGATRIIDGDTLEIDGRTYRLHGIDAPEVGQDCARSDGSQWPCGKRAATALERLVSDHPVRCDYRGSDAYGRVLAVCRANGIDLNAALVSLGLAWSFRRYSNDYDSLEDKARAEGRGVFQAETEPPWKYRAALWEVGAADAKDRDCPIKGNISKQGEMIYHAPWSPWYHKTRVSPDKGERWFCNEGEAIAAGWRAPRWSP